MIVRFSLNDTAFLMLGLDDHGLVDQSFPTLKHIGGTRYEAAVSDLVIILDDCKTRGNAGSGFEHTAPDRRALNRAAATIERALLKAKP